MVGQVFKIIFIQDKAYLTHDKSMTFKQLGLPDVAKSCKEPAFWTIKVIEYKAIERKIFCEIISYQKGQTDFESNQKIFADKLYYLNFVTFKSIDTAGLLKTLGGEPKVIKPVKYVKVERVHVQPVEFVRQPFHKTISETFYVPFKKVQFKLGCVSFYKNIKELENGIEFSISNHDILEEFDAIKNYFVNVLKTKRIEVSIRIEITDNKIVSVFAKSPEIDKIDKQLIDKVKFEFIKSTLKKRVDVDTDKSLFTMDEFFDNISDNEFNARIFYANEKELIDDLLSVTNTKHYAHLRFLSSKHSYEIMKLRFIQKPFSFIFLILGDSKFHLVWETLDTEEATYVWHIDKDLNSLRMTLRKIEATITSIKIHGKIAYISSTEDPFNRIYHDYSDPMGGFAKWKGELEYVLT
jgi:hypothetical protein